VVEGRGSAQNEDEEKRDERCTMDIYVKGRGVIECSSVRKGRYEDMLRGSRVGHRIVEVGS